MGEVDDNPRSGFLLAAEMGPGFDSGWHEHPGKHQLLYGSQGTMTLETEAHLWTLPPMRAAWLAAGVVHRVTCAQGASLRTVYLDHGLRGGPKVADCAVFDVQPLAREMILYSARWGPDDDEDGGLAADFFALLHRLAAEWTSRPLTLQIPRGRSQALQRAIGWTLEHLEEADLQGAARAAAVSPRTLTRRFAQETGTTFRQLLRCARISRALVVLSNPDRSITEVAFEVGFSSAAAFTHAFSQVVGQPPGAYRERVHGGTG